MTYDPIDRSISYLERLDKEASPGPWRMQYEDKWINIIPQRLYQYPIAEVDHDDIAEEESEANADVVILARTLLPSVIQLLLSADEALDYLKFSLGKCEVWCPCVIHALEHAIEEFSTTLLDSTESE